MLLLSSYSSFLKSLFFYTGFVLNGVAISWHFCFANNIELFILRDHKKTTLIKSKLMLETRVTGWTIWWHNKEKQLTRVSFWVRSLNQLSRMKLKAKHPIVWFKSKIHSRLEKKTGSRFYWILIQMGHPTCAVYIPLCLSRNRLWVA